MLLYLIMEPTTTAMPPTIATAEAVAAEPLTRAVSVLENSVHSWHTGKQVEFSKKKSGLQVTFKLLGEAPSLDKPDPSIHCKSNHNKFSWIKHFMKIIVWNVLNLPEPLVLIGNSLQSGKRSSNSNTYAKLTSTWHVVVVILSHPSLVGKITFCSAQKKIGYPCRQRNGIKSFLHLSVAMVSGVNRIISKHMHIKHD